LGFEKGETKETNKNVERTIKTRLIIIFRIKRDRWFLIERRSRDIELIRFNSNLLNLSYWDSIIFQHACLHCEWYACDMPFICVARWNVARTETVISKKRISGKERERERERVCVCVCVSCVALHSFSYLQNGESPQYGSDRLRQFSDPLARFQPINGEWYYSHSTLRTVAYKFRFSGEDT